MIKYTEFGKYLTNYRTSHNMVLGEMTQKLSMKTTRLFDIQMGARITDDEFKMLTEKYPEIGAQMKILYHAVGLDRYDDDKECDGKYYTGRNRYMATGVQLENLLTLEKLGYLSREDRPFWEFAVTEKGFELIRDITGLRIIEEE